MRLLRWLMCFTSLSLALTFEYILNYDRLELAYYDKELVYDSYFLFRKFNRTSHCLNVSFNLIEDLNGNDMHFTTSLHQWASNEYKPLGYKLRFNVCEYWKKNYHGVREHLSNFGNLEGCDIKKGFYYLYNYMPDESQFPKYVPLGKYMARMDVEWDSGKPLLKFEWYVAAELKLRKMMRNRQRKVT